jgi:phosphate transport system permease protein
VNQAGTIAELPKKGSTAGERTREFSPGWIAATVLGVAAALLAPALLVFLLIEGAAFLSRPAAGTILALEWHPREGVFGFTPLLLGTLSTSLLGLLLAFPLSLGAAIHLRFHAGRRVRQLLETVLGILGGTPSVVFGLFGTFWIVPLLGATLASGAIVLAIMITPTLALLSLGVLRQVPEELLQNGARLGLRRDQAIFRLALVQARPGILAACALALARALGEALAVEMVCGNVPNLPTSFTTPVRTLTTTLVQEFEYAQQAHAEALHLVALTVVLLAALACGLGQKLAQRRAA